MNRFFLLIKKDLWLHLSNSSVFFNYLMFSVTVYVLIRFTAGEKTSFFSVVGSYWTAYFLAGYLALNKIIRTETKHASHSALQISGIGSSHIFSASFVSLFCLFAVGQLVLLPVHALFFGVDLLPNIGRVGLLFLVITIGFNSVIILFGRLLSNIVFSDFLLPVICFPVQIPLVIGAVKMTEFIYRGESLANMQPWLVLLLFYDLIFFILGYVLTVLIFD